MNKYVKGGLELLKLIISFLLGGGTAYMVL